MKRVAPVLTLALASLAAPLASAAGGQVAYVTNRNSNSVSVIDTASAAVVDTIGVGTGPQYVAVTPDGREVWVGNALSNNLSVIDTSSDSVVATIPVGRIPHGIDFTPDGIFAYVTNKDDDNFVVISTATRNIVNTVPLVYRPAGIKVASDGGFAYATNELNRSPAPAVSIIDAATQSVVAHVSLGLSSSPLWFDITPDGRYLYIPRRGYTDVAVFETDPVNAVVAAIPTGAGPIGVAVHPQGTFAYASNNIADTVSVISTATNTVIATIPVGRGPVVPGISPDGGQLYMPNGSDGTVSVIDTLTNTVIGTIAVGNTPWGVAFKPPIHGCDGFDPPMDGGAVKVRKNRALPFKARLLDESGNALTDLDVAAPPVIQVLFEGPGQPAEDVTDEAVPAGLGTEGNQFEFNVDVWQFNLKTRNYTAPGTYTVRMLSGDSYLVDPTCEATFIIE